MELRTKRLLSLWDHKTYTNRARPLDKPIDGLFVYQSLFLWKPSHHDPLKTSQHNWRRSLPKVC